MDSRDQRKEDLSCSCQTTVNHFHQKTVASSFQLTEIFDIAEGLVSIWEDSEHCPNGCQQTPQFIQPFLDSVSSLLALFDIIWYDLQSQQEPERLPPQTTHNTTTAAFAFQGFAHVDSPAPPVVTGYQATASIGGFVFPESEKYALVEEIVRGLTGSTNTCVKSIQQSLSRSVPDQQTRHGNELREKCLEVLYKTYSAKGRYQVDTKSL